MKQYDKIFIPIDVGRNDAYYTTVTIQGQLQEQSNAIVLTEQELLILLIDFDNQDLIAVEFIEQKLNNDRLHKI